MKWIDLFENKWLESISQFYENIFHTFYEPYESIRSILQKPDEDNSNEDGMIQPTVDVLEMGVKKEGVLEIEESYDMYSVSLEEDKTYRIQLNKISLVDPYLELYEANDNQGQDFLGALIQKNDNISDEFAEIKDSMITFTPAESGFYYLKVFDKEKFSLTNEGHAGDYTIIVSNISEPIDLTLPFDESGTYKITQTWNNTDGSHHDELIWAYDFVYPTDSDWKAIAVGDGIVVDYREWIEDGTYDDNGEFQMNNPVGTSGIGNFVTILLDTGVYVTYAHLKYDGVDVEIGDSIEEGQTIGAVGLTGFTDGKHLHIHFGSEYVIWGTDSSIVADGSFDDNSPAYFNYLGDENGQFDNDICQGDIKILIVGSCDDGRDDERPDNIDFIEQ